MRISLEQPFGNAADAVCKNTMTLLSMTGGSGTMNTSSAKGKAPSKGAEPVAQDKPASPEHDESQNRQGEPFLRSSGDR
jgi:hypothetical protein